MKSNGDTTFKTNNTSGLGRKNYSQNKALLEIQRIGEENCLSLYEMQRDIAANSKDEDTRSQAQQFLLNKVLPNAKGGRFIKVELVPMENLATIKQNEILIMENVCQGNITLEEGEKLFTMTDQCRKTIESSEIAKMVEEMQKRMKEAGL
jgi:hypothetical protein